MMISRTPSSKLKYFSPFFSVVFNFLNYFHDFFKLMVPKDDTSCDRETRQRQSSLFSRSYLFFCDDRHCAQSMMLMQFEEFLHGSIYDKSKATYEGCAAAAATHLEE